MEGRGVTVTMHTTPPVTVSRPGRLLGVGSVRAALSPGAENASCSVSLDNGDGYFSTLFSVPPLGVLVTIEDYGGEIFRGSVTSCSLAASCDLECES
jgi:hypothetical protein